MLSNVEILISVNLCVGMCKSANEEHGRELPMMNGIKEDIKSIGVLDSGICSEALFSLASRFKSLQVKLK